MLNKKGEMVTGFIVALTIVTSLTGLGLYKTAKNGVLKNNGKKIWCKIQNKGNDFCDAQYAIPE